jgi:nucleoid-associated protein YgaU
MTSDAKIGLLLGLIFIFVIAFVINGLPSLRPQPSKGDVTTNMTSVRDENLGLAEREQKAREKIGWSDLLDKQTEEPKGPVAVTQSVAPATSPEQPVAADSTKEAVRSILPSADGIEKLTKGLEDIVKIVAQASGPAAGQEKTTEPAPSVEVAKSQSKPETRLEQPSATETAKMVKPAASAPAGTAKTYVIVDGDTLASIAKKVYGIEEGNRIINNQRIFEANRNLLKSPDAIVVGQELVIPPPAKPVEKKPDTVLPKTLFEKVEAIGKRRVPAPDKTEPQNQVALKKEPAKPATAERWYVVQDGDNLWRIATTQLGSGARHEEIAKLNAGILKDGVKLNIGMRLRLPSQ